MLDLLMVKNPRAVASDSLSTKIHLHLSSSFMLGSEQSSAAILNSINIVLSYSLYLTVRHATLQYIARQIEFIITHLIEKLNEKNKDVLNFIMFNQII